MAALLLHDKLYIQATFWASLGIESWWEPDWHSAVTASTRPEKCWSLCLRGGGGGNHQTNKMWIRGQAEAWVIWKISQPSWQVLFPIQLGRDTLGFFKRVYLFATAESWSRILPRLSSIVSSVCLFSSTVKAEVATSFPHREGSSWIWKKCMVCNQNHCASVICPPWPSLKSPFLD